MALKKAPNKFKIRTNSKVKIQENKENMSCYCIHVSVNYDDNENEEEEEGGRDVKKEDKDEEKVQGTHKDGKILSRAPRQF